MPRAIRIATSTISATRSRKIRIDLGVRVERNGPWRIGGRDLQENGRYCALFDILYPESDKRRIGSLLYITAALPTPGFTVRFRRPLRLLGLLVPGTASKHVLRLSFSFGPSPHSSSYYGLG